MMNFRVKRAAVLLTAIALLLAAAVGGTIAYLTASTGEVVNIFTPTNVNIKIEEKLNGNVKDDVMITNTGDIDAYIRAMVVVTWQDENGQIYGQMPVGGTKPEAGIDYVIKFSDGFSHWGTKSSDGFYYYRIPVAPGDSTGALFFDCEPIEGKAPKGYKLHVEVIAQAIQAIPVSAVVNSWGVTANPDYVVNEKPCVGISKS